MATTDDVYNLLNSMNSKLDVITTKANSAEMSSASAVIKIDAMATKVANIESLAMSIKTKVENIQSMLDGNMQLQEIKNAVNRLLFEIKKLR